jgi:histidinol-phosphate aminotransferase
MPAGIAFAHDTIAGESRRNAALPVAALAPASYRHVVPRRAPTANTRPHALMSQYWSAVVHGLTPYVPGEQPKLANLVKLNTNEHPYGPSPRAIEAIRAEASDALRLYPDPRADLLKAAIAKRFGVASGEVFVGNGSDEVLAHAFMALLKHKRPVRFPDISYSFYPVYCGLYEIAFETVPLDDSLAIRADDYLGGGSGAAGGIIFPNPNAPTGRLLPLADIERIVRGNPQCVVVVDEAYVDFGGDSAVPLVRNHPNLLVVQTLSKSRSLAGLRVGFAIGHPELIEALDRVKDSFNSYPLDRLAIAGAIAAIEDEEYFERTRKAVIGTREQLTSELASLGFEVLPSAANFVFARHAGRDAGELAAELRARSIIVRHFRQPRIEQFLRITIGTDEQCAVLVAALREILR